MPSDRFEIDLRGRMLSIIKSCAIAKELHGLRDEDFPDIFMFHEADFSTITEELYLLFVKELKKNGSSGRKNPIN